MSSSTFIPEYTPEPSGSPESQVSGGATLNPETLGAKEFRRLVYARASECYRDLPWRRDPTPYAVLVSEFMLQQTQVPRVIPKYVAWLRLFPTVHDLAIAPSSAVLAAWSGLGYNRRALALHSSARHIDAEFGGQIPDDEAALRSLPGIGAYTSRAILAFAFNRPVVFLETNVRTVLLKYFYPAEDKVPDTRLIKTAEYVLDRDAPSKWYTALMDYGAQIKKEEQNHNRRSASYHKQSPFNTSFRRVRGELLKLLVAEGPLNIETAYGKLPFSHENIERSANELASEGFIVYSGGQLYLAEQLSSATAATTDGESRCKNT
jgi:A/G-specific adenine glycosylase